MPSGRNIPIMEGCRRQYLVRSSPAMTARRSGCDWLKFHRRKHGQARSKSSKTRDGAAAHKGDSEGKIVDGQSRKTRVGKVHAAPVEGPKIQIRKIETRDLPARK